MDNIKSVLVITNLDKPGAFGLRGKVEAWFAQRGIQVFHHSFTGRPEAFTPPCVDLVLVLGGDGTVLYSARLCSPVNAPLLGINLGTFGFLAEVEPEKWEKAMALCLKGKLESSSRIMLDIALERRGKILYRSTCLNDVVVSSCGRRKIVNLSLCISDRGVMDYRADGIILATPTGSTAYSMAAGGPILQPELSSVVINPINPFSLSNRALLIPAGENIMVQLSSYQQTELGLTVDGQENFALKPDDKVLVQKHDQCLKLLSFSRMQFYEVLRNKLNWKGQPHD